jgi:predicted permease
MPAVMLSYRYWRSELGGDSAVLGRTIDVDGVAHRVVGVATREWDFPERVTMWASSLDTREMETRQRRMMVLVKLREGVDADRARARIVGIGNGAIAALPRRRANEVLSSASFREFAQLRLGGIVLALTIISVFVGFLTAVNFAALILARGIRRRAELGVRAALGASPWRLARHIIAESLLLCAIGGLVAALLSPSVIGLIRAGFGEMLPAWLTITISWRLVAVSAVLAMLLGAVFALGPALDIARPALTGLVRAASSTVADAGLARTRSWIVGIQVALATAVLISLGAVMGRSLLMRTPVAGFDYRPLIVSEVSDSGRAEDVSARLTGLLWTVRETPGVGSAAYLDGTSLDPTMVIADLGPNSMTAEDEGLETPWLGRAGEDFFHVMRPVIAQGRLFTLDEERQGAPVAVVSRVIAHSMFADAPIGKRIRLGVGQSLTIVGVIEDIRLRGYQTDPTEAVFTPMAARAISASGFSVGQVWIRASGPIGLTERLVQSRGSATGNGHLRMIQTHSMASSMAEELAAYRSVAQLTLAIFGVALSLAALGIYGLVAYSAEMRSRELAIREALGASRLEVAGLVLRGALVQTMTGAAAGAMIGIIVVDYLNGFQLKLTTTGMATAVAFSVVALTVLISSVGPLHRTWRRGLSQALRA